MKKILVVEDEKALNEAYQLILKKNNYEVYSAYDGKEAVEITKKVDPDLILLDLRMPSMGGIEFLKNYNHKKLHPTVKIIVFSNMDTEKDIEEAYNLGADKYMLKAWVAPNELIKLIEQVLAEG